MPATYGDVTAEYLAARSDAGLVESGREIVWVRGPDSVAFLDGLLSQSVAALAAGDLAESLLLSPQGKLRALLWVLRREGEVGLVADTGFGSQVVADLTRFKIRVEAELALDPVGTIEVWGPRSAEVVAAANLPVPATRHWLWSGDAVVARLALGRSGHDRFLIAGSQVEELIVAGATRVGHQAATTVRIEAGELQMGVDVDEATIPQEAGLVEAAVDFEKGCYLGQELVARIESRGRVNRHLRSLTVREAIIPPSGAVVLRDDNELGVLTSVGESFELRAPVALAMIRREARPGDVVRLEWESGFATAEVHGVPLDVFDAADS